MKPNSILNIEQNPRCHYIKDLDKQHCCAFFINKIFLNLLVINTGLATKVHALRAVVVNDVV